MSGQFVSAIQPPSILIHRLMVVQVPPIERKNLYSLQYSSIQQRISITELWDLLTKEGKPKPEGSVPANGHIGPMGGTGKKGHRNARSGGANGNVGGYWWSK